MTKVKTISVIIHVFICIYASLRVNIFLKYSLRAYQITQIKDSKMKTNEMVILGEIYLFRGYFQGPHLPGTITGSLLLCHTLSIAIFTDVQFTVLKSKKKCLF